MNTLWWIVTVILMGTGLVGTVIPLLPGTTIILAAALLHHLVLGPEGSSAWVIISGLVALTLLSYALEIVSGSLGAKWFGATRWGALGGILGALIGLFFGLPGIFIGPLLGVLAGELLGGRGLLPAGKSTWGTLLGTGAGMIGNLLIGLLMIGWFVLAVLSGNF